MFKEGLKFKTIVGYIFIALVISIVFGALSINSFYTNYGIKVLYALILTGLSIFIVFYEALMHNKTFKIWHYIVVGLIFVGVFYGILFLTSMLNSNMWTWLYLLTLTLTTLIWLTYKLIYKIQNNDNNLNAPAYLLISLVFDLSFGVFIYQTQSIFDKNNPLSVSETIKSNISSVLKLSDHQLNGISYIEFKDNELLVGAKYDKDNKYIMYSYNYEGVETLSGVYQKVLNNPSDTPEAVIYPILDSRKQGIGKKGIISEKEIAYVSYLTVNNYKNMLSQEMVSGFVMYRNEGEEKMNYAMYLKQYHSETFDLLVNFDNFETSVMKYFIKK